MQDANFYPLSKSSFMQWSLINYLVKRCSDLWNIKDSYACRKSERRDIFHLRNLGFSMSREL